MNLPMKPNATLASAPDYPFNLTENASLLSVSFIGWKRLPYRRMEQPFVFCFLLMSQFCGMIFAERLRKKHKKLPRERKTILALLKQNFVDWINIYVLVAGYVGMARMLIFRFTPVLAIVAIYGVAIVFQIVMWHTIAIYLAKFMLHWNFSMIDTQDPRAIMNIIELAIKVIVGVINAFPLAASFWDTAFLPRGFFYLTSLDGKDMAMSGFYVVMICVCLLAIVLSLVDQALNYNGINLTKFLFVMAAFSIIIIILIWQSISSTGSKFPLTVIVIKLALNTILIYLDIMTDPSASVEPTASPASPVPLALKPIKGE